MVFGFILSASKKHHVEGQSLLTPLTYWVTLLFSHPCAFSKTILFFIGIKFGEKCGECNERKFKTDQKPNVLYASRAMTQKSNC